MSFKRRRLSASPSSRSSTPALAPHPAPTLAPQPQPAPASSPAPSSLGSGADAGPSRPTHGQRHAAPASASATPAPAEGKVGKEPKFGALVPGSGDGSGCGEECFNWADLPLNARGFRYVPCALSPVPSPTPSAPFYRAVGYPAPCPPVHLDWLDRSPFLRLSPTALTCTSDRGFRSARANTAVRHGSWYYEAVVERSAGPGGGGGRTGLLGTTGGGGGGGGGGEATKAGGGGGNPHVRVGWARREANLDAPVGMDGYGYAVRDVGGEKVHLSRPKTYGRPFQAGDVVGCLITLPPRTAEQLALARSADHPAHVRRSRVPIHWKGQHYFEMDEYHVAKEMETLIDREGKVAKAAKAAAEAAKANGGVTGHVGLNGAEGEEGAAKPKKGAATKTKNAKKEKASAGEHGQPGSGARPLETLQGSRIEFYLNGEPLGTAFDNLYDYIPLPPVRPVGTKKGHGHQAGEHKVEVQHDDGTLGYFPMVSCFGRGKVRVNFGPEWVCPPRWSAEALAAAQSSKGKREEGGGAGIRPMCDRRAEFRAEVLGYDEQDEREAEVGLRAQMEEMEMRRQAAEERAAKAALKGAGPVGKGGKGKKKGQAGREERDGTRERERSTTAGTPGPRGGKRSRAGSVLVEAEAGMGKQDAEGGEQDAEGEEEDVPLAMALGRQSGVKLEREEQEDPEEGVDWAGRAGQDGAGVKLEWGGGMEVDEMEVEKAGLARPLDNADAV